MLPFAIDDGPADDLRRRERADDVRPLRRVEEVGDERRQEERRAAPEEAGGDVDDERHLRGLVAAVRPVDERGAAAEVGDRVDVDDVGEGEGEEAELGRRQQARQQGQADQGDDLGAAAGKECPRRGTGRRAAEFIRLHRSSGNPKVLKR